MLICSQNCNIIVKLEDITSIYVDHINLAALEMEEKYTICCTLRNETSVIRLGEYKNKEKCDEIMAEILLIYNEIMRSTIKGTTFIPNYYYKLPYE